MIARSILAFQKGISKTRMNRNSSYLFNSRPAVGCFEEGQPAITGLASGGSGTTAPCSVGWGVTDREDIKMRVTFLP